MDELIKAVRDLQAGDADAFQIIYEQTYRKTLAHIRRYCDDEDQCEDFLQETYMQLYKNINQLENPEALQGWLNTTAKRLIGRRAEKDKKMPTRTFSAIAAEDGQEVDFEDEREEANPELISDRKAVAEIVNQILEMLPKEQREALMMVYGQKVTIKKLASQLNISENTIKSRLLQGRRKLTEHKADFRRLGIELPAVGIATLIAVTYRENLAAQAAVGAAADAVLKGSSAEATASEGPGAFIRARAAAEDIVSDAGSSAATSTAAASITGAAAGSVASAGTAAGVASAAGAASTAGAAGTASAAGAAATAAAAKAAGTGIAVKLLAGAAAVAVAGGIAAGVVTSKGHSDSAQTPSTEISAELSTDAALSDTEADSNAGAPVDIDLSTDEAEALNELYTYADEANNTDRYLARYLLDNYALISDIYNKLPDKTAMYTGDGFVHGTTGTGVYMKSASEIYVGEIKNGLPDGYGCLARLTVSDEFCSIEEDADYSPKYIVPCVDVSGYTGGWANGKANGHGCCYSLMSDIVFNTNGLTLISESTEEVVEPGIVSSIDTISTRESTFADELADGEYLIHSGNARYSNDHVIPVNNGQVDESRLGGTTFEIEDLYDGIKEYQFHWEEGRTTGYIVYPELGGFGNTHRWDSTDTWDQTEAFIYNAAPIEFKNGVYFTNLDVASLDDAAKRAGFDNSTAWHYLEKLAAALNTSLSKDMGLYEAELMPITDANTIILKLRDYDSYDSPRIVFTYSAADDSCTVTSE